MNISPCWYCGKEMAIEKKTNQRLFHPECLIKFQTEQKALKDKYISYKSEIMFYRAISHIEKQNKTFMSDYYDEAQLVHEMSQAQPTKFGSSDEMMVAMELVRQRIHAKVQFKVGRRRVDFLLPKLHVALEVDGAIHKFRIKKDSEREIEIMNKLAKNQGGNWEVIRIPTDLIESDLTKLVPAIKVLYQARQKLRAENGGFLPTYWNRTNKISQIKALKNVDDDTLKTIDSFNELHPAEL